MKLNSLQLEAFYTIAQHLNFTRAAEALHVTQSALSQRVAKLEEDLETTLLVRLKNSIRLTEQGEKLLRFCQLNQAAESDLLLDLIGEKNKLGGILKIAGFSSVNRSLVIPALKNLMLANLNLSIQIMTKETRELDELLKRSEVDYIITNLEPSSPHIESLLLGYEENVLVTSKKFPETEFYLDHDENDPITEKYLSKYKVNLKNLKRRYLDDVYSLIDGVKNGYGKALLPRHLIENSKDLEIVNPLKTLRTPIFIQYFKQTYYKKVHSHVVNDLSSHIGLFNQTAPRFGTRHI
jgi:DNA-binding transcriptional LysR family regulator